MTYGDGTTNSNRIPEENGAFVVVIIAKTCFPLQKTVPGVYRNDTCYTKKTPDNVLRRRAMIVRHHVSLDVSFV